MSRNEPKAIDAVTLRTGRSVQNLVLVLALVKGEDGVVMVRCQHAPHTWSELPIGDEHPRSVGVVDGVEFWADEATRIAQLPSSLATQPYAAVTYSEVLLWCRGWPPDLCDPTDEPSLRLELARLRAGPVAVTLAPGRCIPLVTRQITH